MLNSLLYFRFLLKIKCKATSIFLSLCADVLCDVCGTNLPDGSSIFCVWMCRLSQQGALSQMDQSLHDQTAGSLGEVSGCNDLKSRSIKHGFYLIYILI